MAKKIIKIQKAILTIPKMKTKRVFLGAYGGHYSAVVVFNEKPKYSEESHHNIETEWVDCSENRDCIIGCTTLDEFKELFPTVNLDGILSEDGLPDSIEVTRLMEVEMTACFDEYGKMTGLDFDLDGWL